MMKIKLFRWVAILALLTYVALLLSAWIGECAGVERAVSEGEMTANPVGMLSRFAFIGVLPLAFVGIFSAWLPRPILISAALLGALVFLIIFIATIAPRSWRVNSFPSSTDTEAWEHAKRQIEFGNRTESYAHADGRIIWYLKGAGASTGDLLFSLLCSFPCTVFLAEFTMRKKFDNARRC